MAWPGRRGGGTFDHDAAGPRAASRRAAIDGGPSRSAPAADGVIGPGAPEPAARAPLLLASALAIALGAGAGAFVARSVALTARSITPLPWWDQWDVVRDLARWQRGAWAPLDLLALHNEHRLLFPRLLFILDLFVFRGTDSFLCAMNLALQALHVLVLWALLREARLGSLTLASGLAAFAALCLFAPVQLENFAWGFQVQFVGVYLAASAAFLFAARSAARAAAQPGAPAKPTVSARSAETTGPAGSARSAASDAARDGREATAAAIGCAAIATYTMANGILAWPLLFALGVWLRLPRARLAAIAAAGLVVGGSFLHGHSSTGDMLAVLALPWRVGAYLALFVGGPFQAFGEWAAGLLGGLGLASSALALIAVLRSRRARDPATAAIAAIALFTLGTALLAAIGRQDLPLLQALSPRYGTPALLLWWAQAALWALSREGDGAVRRAAWRPAAALAGCAAIAVALFAGWQHDGQVARFYFQTRTRAAVALLAGVDDLTDVRPVQPEGYAAFALAPVLERQRVSLYATAPPPLGAPLVRRYPIAPRERCRGVLEAVEPIPPPDGEAPPGSPARPAWLRPGVRATGWALDVEARAPAREVLLVDRAGMIVGLGRNLVERPDGGASPELGAAEAQAGADALLGWFGLARRRERADLTAYAVLADRSACRLDAPGPD